MGAADEQRRAAAEAENSLGTARIAAGDRGAAAAHFQRAVDLEPTLAKAWSNLGATQRGTGDLEGAIHSLSRSLAIDAHRFRAWNNLGNALRQASRVDEARAAYERSLALEPAAASTHLALGRLLAETGRVVEASHRLAEGLRVDPEGPHAVATRAALAELLAARGLREESRAVLAVGARGDRTASERIALADALLTLAGADTAEAALVGLSPEDATAAPWWALQKRLREARGDVAGAERAALSAAGAAATAFAWCEVARLRARRGDPAGAAKAVEHAEAAEPLSPAPPLFLGETLLVAGDYGGAEAAFHRAARLAPSLAEPDANLAKLASMRGEIDEAIARLRSVLARRPGLAVARSNLLLTLHYAPPTPEAMLAEHLAWSRHHVPLAAPAAFAPRAPATGRRLRVGYVSADLREHAVARLFEPLLASHDRARFDVHLYASCEAPDAFTARLRSLGDTWRDVHGASDAELARIVREDAIDVLVDLGGHTAGHRLAAFGERPAPVLCSFLGYPDTTGIPAVDVRLTDALADPPGAADRLATEALVRLPRTAWCFRPDEATPPVATRSPDAPLVFGVFNNVSKVGARARRAFARVLAALPEARLLVKGRTLADPRTRARVLAEMHELGVADRVELRSWTPGHASHLATYGEVDVALDTFPYAGTTSTCEALWMGVPVVSLVGDTHASRVGASLLAAVGLEELTAQDEDDYVARAVALGRDRARITALRRSLRQRMQRSPLLDGASWARAIEAVYLDRFESWRVHAEATRGAPDAWLGLPDGGVVSVPDDASIATRFVLEERGDWFEPELQLVRRLLGEGDCALDVGANFGVYAVAMGRRVGPRGRVLALEPAPSTAAHLRRSAARVPALRVLEVAAGAERGRSAFDPGASPELGRLVAASEASPLQIDVVPLDDLLSELDGLALAKVDAEGSEPAVLRGARRLVAREDPVWIWELRHGREIAHDLLAELGASAPHLQLMRWVSTLGALVPLDPRAPLDPRWLNMVAVSTARREDLVRRGLAVEGAPRGETRQVEGPVGVGDVLAARREDGTLGQRFHATLTALALARAAVRDRWSASRALLLARVAHEAGYDGEAAAVAVGVLSAIARGASLRLDEPTLPPLPRQDARMARIDPAIAVEVLAIEAQLELGAWSAFYVPDVHGRGLARLAALDVLTPELTRAHDALQRFRARAG